MGKVKVKGEIEVIATLTVELTAQIQSTEVSSEYTAEPTVTFEFEAEFDDVDIPIRPGKYDVDELDEQILWKLQELVDENLDIVVTVEGEDMTGDADINVEIDIHEIEVM